MPLRTFNGLFAIDGYLDWNKLVDYYAGKTATKIVALGEGGDYECDGVDDHVQILSALNALNLNGALLIKSGVYSVDGIKKSINQVIADTDRQEIVLQGEGKFNTILRLKAGAEGVQAQNPNFTTPATLLFENENDSGIRVTIRDIGVDGQRTLQTKNICGIALVKPRNAVVEDCLVQNASKFGIAFERPNNCYRESYCRRNIVYRIWNYDSSVPPSPVESNCVGIHSTMADLYIRHNIVGWIGYVDETTRYGYGIVLEDSDICDGSVIWGNKVGIFPLAGSADHQIINNYVDVNSFYGIWLYNTHNTLVSGNFIRQADGYIAGIKISNATTKSSIINNQFRIRSGTLAYGIQEVDTSDETLIENNHLLTTGGVITTPIAWVGANTIVRNNLGFKTENKGNSIGTGAQQTIPHGLATGLTPNNVTVVPTESGATVTSFWADGTNIYCTVTSGKPFKWSASLI